MVVESSGSRTLRKARGNRRELGIYEVSSCKAPPEI